MRKITDHMVTKLNRENITVEAVDEKNEQDGGNHKYLVQVCVEGENGKHIIESCPINFQNGGLADVGPNGITDQALLAVVLDRLRGFNAGQFSCRDNAIAITKIEEDLLWMGKRANDRANRGVEGKREA